MKALILLMAIVLSAQCIGCGSTTDSTGKPASLINLVSGGPWKYRVEWKDQVSGEQSIAFDHITLGPGIGINGEVWDTVLHSNDFNPIPDFFPLMATRDDGIWVRFDRDERAFHLFKYPASPGESWPLDPSYTGPDQWANKSTMTGVESVTIGSTTFVCLVYQYIVSGGHHAQVRNIYIAPGFTIVKGIYISDTNVGYDTVTYTLVQ